MFLLDYEKGKTAVTKNQDKKLMLIGLLKIMWPIDLESHLYFKDHMPTSPDSYPHGKTYLEPTILSSATFVIISTVP